MRFLVERMSQNFFELPKKEEVNHVEQSIHAKQIRCS